MHDSERTYQCIIIGSGFSGICMGIKLQESGLGDFLILEKGGDVGGTWRDNQYPGAECDVPSALYSYSFERKTDWNYQWSEQPQILDYIHSVVDKHGLRTQTRFDSEVASAQYDADKAIWVVRLTDGAELTTRYLVSAVGQLHRPSIPQFKDQGSFEGPAFHSAAWQQDVDLTGKSVAVIGNAASAVQFVPIIAAQVADLTIYQRSPNWLAQKLDRPYTEKEKARMQRFPILKSISRLGIYLRNELIVYSAIKGNRLTIWLLRKTCLDYLKDTVKDEELRTKLIPDYPIGAKRILTADGYYEALCRDNVELVTEPIERFEHNGITTTTSQKRKADVIIYGTGFITNPFLDGIEIVGRNGQHLSDHWSQGAFAYLGVATNEFPNLFFLYGPNTNLGHNSILLMSEAQVNYIIQAMQAVKTDGASSIEVRSEVESSYNKKVQARLNKMSWNSVEDSWYKSGNRITNNWPGSVQEYRRSLRSFAASDFVLDR